MLLDGVGLLTDDVVFATPLACADADPAGETASTPDGTTAGLHDLAPVLAARGGGAWTLCCLPPQPTHLGR